MVWVRLDDAFYTHRKIVELSTDARWLHVAALCYCNQNLTDGVLSRSAAETIGMMRNPRRAIRELVTVGLWDERPAALDGGYEIHDYLEFQPSREKILAERAATAERQKRMRDKRRNGVTNAVTNAVRDAVTNGSVTPTPVPYPDPDVLHPLQTEVGSDPEAEEETTQKPRQIEDRAANACGVLGDWAHNAAVARGGVRNEDAHRSACRAGARREYLDAARTLARANPRWAAHELAAALEGQVVSDHRSAVDPDLAGIYAGAEARRRAADAEAPPADHKRNADRVKALRAARQKEDPDHA